MKIVLYIDDDDSILQMGQEFLERYGCRVKATNNPGVAEELLNQGGQFDAVISDYNMPGNMNGIELLQKIKSFGVPFIIYSSDETIASSAIEAGALACIPKAGHPSAEFAHLSDIVKTGCAAA